MRILTFISPLFHLQKVCVIRACSKKNAFFFVDGRSNLGPLPIKLTVGIPPCETVSIATGEWDVRCMHSLCSKLGLLSGVFDSTSVLNLKTLFERLFQELLVRFHDGQSRSKRWPSTRKTLQDITKTIILNKV